MSQTYIFWGLLQWLIGNGFIIILSLVLWSNVRIQRPHIDYAILLFYYMLVITFFVLAMGVLGFLERSIMATVSLLAGWALLYCYRENVVSSTIEIKRILLNILKSCSSSPFLTMMLFIAILLVGLRMLAHIWILSPYIWDTLSYHLPKIADWVQHEKIVALSTPVLRSFWPANFELFQTWFVVFFHHDFIIEAAGLPFYLLALISVYSIGRSLSMTRGWSIFATILYGLTPAVFMNAVSCKNDIVVMALFLFILALLLDYRKNRDKFFERMVLVFAALLFGLGTKPTMVFILPGICLIAIWCFWKRKRQYIVREEQKQIFVSASVILIAAIFLGGYWYVRNYTMFDNPFYPTDFRICGKLYFGDGLRHGGQQGTFKLESISLNFKDLTNKIFDPATYSADLGGMTGWGWFVFSCGLPAGLLALFLKREIRWLSAGFLLSLACLFGFVTPDPWNMRFATWFPAIFVVSFASITSGLKIKSISWSLISLAIIGSSLNFMGCISTGYAQPQEWRSRAKVSVWDRTTISDTVANAVHKYVLFSPNGDTINYITHGNAMIYQFYGPAFSRRIQYLQLRMDMDILDQMKSKKAHCLILLEWDQGIGEWHKLLEQNVELKKMKHVSDFVYCLADIKK